jgi:hypothetical protein
MSQELRIETILNKLMDFDIYFREFLQLDLARMKAIKLHRDNVIELDTEESEPEGDAIQWERAMLQCEHKECHRVNCKLKEL